MKAKTTKKTTKSEEINVDLITEICAPAIRLHRSLTPQQVGHAIMLAYPERKFSAAGLRRAVAEAFRVVVDMPL